MIGGDARERVAEALWRSPFKATGAETMMPFRALEPWDQERWKMRADSVLELIAALKDCSDVLAATLPCLENTGGLRDAAGAAIEYARAAVAKIDGRELSGVLGFGKD